MCHLGPYIHARCAAVVNVDMRVLVHMGVVHELYVWCTRSHGIIAWWHRSVCVVWPCCAATATACIAHELQCACWSDSVAARVRGWRVTVPLMGETRAPGFDREVKRFELMVIGTPNFNKRGINFKFPIITTKDK